MSAPTDDGREQAVIIATRNRPADLRRTLQSIARQKNAADLLVLVVDGSDPDVLQQNKEMIAGFSTPVLRHLSYPGLPAGTRQRNYGVDHLPESVDVIHFLDDDVTVLPEYFGRLARSLGEDPRIGGVGGQILRPDGTAPAAHPLPWLHRFFLLTSRTPGRVLPSGHTATSQEIAGSHRLAVQWLSTCASSYRRAVFDRHRFDPEAEGHSPRLEDLDFSYRVGRTCLLLVDPRARLIHHRSPVNRRSVERFARESLPRRYWFVEKNIRHPLRKPAFWWSVLGQLLARSISRKPERDASLHGLMRGISVVLRRDHPLLRRNAGGST